MASIYLIPNLLGESPLTVLSPQVAQAVQDLTYFVVENEKSARKFIKLIAPEKPQSELQISVIDKHQFYPLITRLTSLLVCKDTLLASSLRQAALVWLTQGLK